MRIILYMLFLILFPSSGLATTFYCFGNEPFWSLNINKKSMMYEKAGEIKHQLQFVTPKKASGMTVDFVRVYKTRLLKNNKPATIVMTLNKSGCSDDMSDQNHQYNVVVILPHEILSGCCNRKQ